MVRPKEHRWNRFLCEVGDELAKVNWPNRKEVMTYSIVVIVTVCVLGTFVFGLDVLFSRIVIDLFGQ